MRQAVIIVLIIVFSLSTVGVYIAAAGTPARQPAGQARDTGAVENRQRDPDLPSYLQTGDPKVRGTLEATNRSEVTVELGDGYFEPTVLRVDQGTAVTWRNQGSSEHSVASDKSSPRSGLASGPLETGESYQYTFDKPGTYNYYSQSNPTSMRAVIQVVR